MVQIEIKRVTLSDIGRLQQVSRQTFLETFSAGNTEGNINAYVEEAFAEERLKNEISNPNSEFYFAETNGSVIGYLKVNFGLSQTELQDNEAVEIERIYVLKDFLRRKVGQLLYEKALEIASQRNASYVWLGVWQEIQRR